MQVLSNKLVGRLFCLFAAAVLGTQCVADEVPGADRFRQHVQPVLEQYCYDCHGYGASEGGRTLDEFDSDKAMVNDRELWSAVLKNVRAGIMPPAGEPRPSADQWQPVKQWIMADAFGIDFDNPDPGRVTIRRLNRSEYRNTIRDLMGVDFNSIEEFPPDDTGYGFDNIGEVLSLSPLLMEKYLQAAETIVAEAVPTSPRVVAERRARGHDFQSEDGSASGEEMSFFTPAKVSHTIHVDHPGRYHVIVDAEVDGWFKFDPGRANITFQIDGQPLYQEEHAWAESRPVHLLYVESWQPGEHTLSFALEPLVDPDQQDHKERSHFSVNTVRVEGPWDEPFLVEPQQYRRFFPKGPPTDSPQEQEDYARDILRDFATRAFRRPVDEETVERLGALAKEVYDQPESRFEQGVARAMVAILASPRFLFRIEQPDPGSTDDPYPLVDEYSLASRLSYFLWSTMPDDELIRLAGQGELRANLSDQVQRMLADPKSRALSENFTGQWLQARDAEHTSINEVRGLATEEELKQIRAMYRQFWRQAKSVDGDDEQVDPEEPVLDDEEIDRIMNLVGDLKQKLRDGVRRLMRRETEMSFEYVLREDRDVLELVGCDYTFLNERLAEHYRIPGVEGNQMRRVTLPPDSPRGGVLTQASTLLVTSNPTRTSPAKRGQFILQNILGTPAPPPPAKVPPLEEAAKAFADHEPTAREMMEFHRSEPLCASCHARIDPLGLALENFNIVGRWRDTEHGMPIDASGELITGEKFDGIRGLKNVLKEGHRLDFYRCLTEKLLTYALGRGLEYYDQYTVDRIVRELDEHEGQSSVLLMGIVESAPFQRQRRAVVATADKQANIVRPSNHEVPGP